MTTLDSSPSTPESAAAPGDAVAFQRCINPDCGFTAPVDRVLVRCPECGALLDVDYDWDKAWPEDGETPRSFDVFDRRRLAVRGLDYSGVWRFRELMPYWKESPEGEDGIVSVGEGRTLLQQADSLAADIGMDAASGGRLFLQYEGYNPSGSFKDNGMTAAFTHARIVGATRVACASTGNTSASMALFAARSGVKCYIFIGDGKIAYGKLSQALDYGGTTLQIAGDFDACLAHVRHIAEHRPELGVYLMNSVNPFRLEGQKSIMLRVLEGLGWEVPDWIVVPGGNLGNSSAFGKAFIELHKLGMISKVPRLAVINAAGARTLDRVYNEIGARWNGGRYDREAVEGEFRRMDDAGERASTVASAIEINRPVNLPKALRALDFMNGVVRSVDDREIVEHKALVGLHGYGCEPASGASVAGARLLRREGVIGAHETVVCVLTGHQLKDPDVTVGYHAAIGPKAHVCGEPGAPEGRVANRPIQVANDLEAIIAELGRG